ncbi:TolC family protein [Verrucomicrobium sp. BvORR106]|uniref:TolC family protein n=1 Tax=Verrucomicrobium sp. BvORR106 TaxID=1403819 RepID=UPI00056E76E9|nr:TolC family protein [Verrucomicrobium sp. BvORR106]
MAPLSRLSISTSGACLAALALTCCTPGQMRRSADREVFGILKSKSSGVPNAGTGLLDISPPPPVSLEELRKNTGTAEFLGNRATVEKNARVIPLHEALSLAVKHNRDYQARKELLYLQALDLTLVRNEFTPIFSAVGGAEVTHTQKPVTQTVKVPNPAYAKAQAAAAKAAAAAASSGTTATTTTTTTAAPVVPQFIEKQITTLVTDNTLTAQGNLGVSILTRTGARIAADFTTDFLKFLSGNMTSAGDSSLAVTLSQPLLRGAGYRATMETLTQAERDLLYAIRDFTQYRKTFAVDIASRYYRTLEARDAARNAYLAYKAFETILTSERALAKEDRRTSSQLGLIEQASLRYKRIWISSVRTYESLLDDLKVALAIPVTTPVILEDQELTKLALEEPELTVDDSLETALVTRLDLYNSRNSLEDSERKIKVSTQGLLPQLDFTGRYTTDGEPGSRNINLNLDRHRLSAGLDLDLRLDKKGDRNAYRSALVAQQRAARQLDLAEENVRLSLRADWRDLDAARKQHEIAATGVALSLRRLEEEELLRTLGRGTARDLIDAQQDLIEAKDDLTSALIAHTLSRLRLWKDMGVLYIKKDGSWIRVLKNEGEVAGDD